MAASTSHQRLYIRCLLRDLDLSTDVIGIQHGRVLKAAGLQARHDQSVDDFTTGLTRRQAGDLINELQREKGKR